MSDIENLQKINKELKVYINESSFISIKCRNRILKIFADEFAIDLDIDNYKNVDLSIQDDFSILYREDIYKSSDKIASIDELLERYHRFQEKADLIIKKKNIDFQGKRKFNDFANLVIVICMIFLALIVIYFGFHAFLTGNYYDCFWLVIFILPSIVPKFKESLQNRFIQAKQYIKRIFK